MHLKFEENPPQITDSLESLEQSLEVHFLLTC